MKSREYIIVYIIPMVLALVFLILALRMEHFSSRILPLVMSGFCLVLGAIGIGREILKRGKLDTTSGQDEATEMDQPKESWAKYAIVGSWVVGFFLAIFLFGFVIAIPVFLLAYLKAQGIKWVKAIAFSVATGAFVYVVFVAILELYFYEGLISSFLKVPTIHLR